MEHESNDVTVNGDRLRVPPGSSLVDVVRAYGLDPEDVRGVAVALNDDVIRREVWTDTPVRAGDRVEIVTAQQGG